MENLYLWKYYVPTAKKYSSSCSVKLTVLTLGGPKNKHNWDMTYAAGCLVAACFLQSGEGSTVGATQVTSTWDGCFWSLGQHVYSLYSSRFLELQVAFSHPLSFSWSLQDCSLGCLQYIVGFGFFSALFFLTKSDKKYTKKKLLACSFHWYMKAVIRSGVQRLRDIWVTLSCWTLNTFYIAMAAFVYLLPPTSCFLS